MYVVQLIPSKKQLIPSIKAQYDATVLVYYSNSFIFYH